MTTKKMQTRKNHSWIISAIEWIILSKPKRDFRRKTAYKLEVLERTLETCERERARFEKYNLHEVAHLFSASQFCLICEADISALLCEMMCTNESWSQLLYARLLALTLVEGVEDVPRVLGKQFRDALEKMVSDQSYLKRLNSITKPLSEFKRKHEKELREIRNVIAAHRDLEARKQIQIIEKMDVQHIRSLTTEFLNSLLEFTKLMTEILKEFTLPNMVKGRVNFKLITERMLQASNSKSVIQSDCAVTFEKQ